MSEDLIYLPPIPRGTKSELVACIYMFAEMDEETREKSFTVLERAVNDPENVQFMKDVMENVMDYSNHADPIVQNYYTGLNNLLTRFLLNAIEISAEAHRMYCVEKKSREVISEETKYDRPIIDLICNCYDKFN